MKPCSLAICNALLEHHRTVCLRPEGPLPPEQCLVTYGQICDVAHVPMSQAVNVFMHEIAIWCAKNKFPPLNSLVVNQDSHVPGDGYDNAPNCSLANWTTERAECIAFRGYPDQADRV